MGRVIRHDFGRKPINLEGTILTLAQLRALKFVRCPACGERDMEDTSKSCVQCQRSGRGAL